MRVLEKVFLGTIARESLLPSGSHITAAVSGGADSVAMLYLLCRFADARDWHIDVLHINHRLRAASDEDESFVRSLAGQLDVPAHFVSPEPDAKGSMESRWSSIRQSIYMEQPGIVAVAHTASDRAETILMRLFEGAGLRGLGGMDYLGVGPVQRPLLDMQSAEIRDWLKENGHHWVEDSSNLDMDMSRNRLRLGVMPALEEQFPEAVSGICRSGALLSHWRDLQDQLSGLTGGDNVSREELLEVHGVLGALMLWQMAGRPRNGFDEFQKILDWIHRGGRGKHILPGGKRLIVEDELVRVEPGGPGRF